MSYYAKKFDDKIVELLRDGGVGLLPTDTIYGLSAVALSEQAVERVHKLKKRDSGKPLVVLISELRQLKELGLKPEQAEIVKKYWPGSLSAVFESQNIPAWLQLGTNSLAVRLPGSKKLRELIKKVGPIVSTSANLQGQKPVSSVDEAKEYFGENLDFYVDVGDLQGQPSTLVKIENDHLKIIRPGALNI